MKLQFFAAFFLFGIPGFALAAPTGDALLDRMQGRWIAEGVRQFAISGRKTLLHAEVNSVIIDGALVSENLWTETPAESDSPIRPTRYRSVYWIRPNPQTSGQYLLGYGRDPSSPQAGTGSFDGLTLRTVQAAGQSPEIRMETESRFSGAGASAAVETSDRVFIDGTLSSSAVIHYQPAP